jgi:hypothetical protein
LAIIFGALVLIGDQHGDRGTGGFAFKYTRKYFYRVAFLALGCNFGLAGLAFIQFALYIVQIHIQLRRAAVDNNANSLAMRFAECGYPE